MQLFEGVRLALQQIREQKLKSAFSLLGVIVGVMFLIVVVSVVEGMDRYIREDLSSAVFGVNTVTLRRIGANESGGDDEARRERRRRPRLTFADFEALRDQLTVTARIGVQSDVGGRVEADNGRLVEGVNIVSITPEVFEIRDWQVERGRPFTAQEDARGAAVVVLGKDTAETLFPGLDPVGRRVRIRGYPYRVIGVLEELGTLFGQSLDNLAVAPARSPLKAVTSPGGFIEEVIIQTDDPASLRAAQLEAEGIMRVRRRLRPGEPNNFSLETADESLSFWDRISQMLFLALPGLVAISLVVGGIVIMNIMLVSVMERTREIGVRKALGARRRDILTQVLIESTTLSSVGAAVGVGIGVGLTVLVRALTPLPAAVDPKWITVGVALGMIVGIVSGVYPANRAAKLDPVDALRYE
ncbi:MAG: ABC transporter permease [Gemmatimonadetes bacterium]|nr:MAG: ABC transporter permease [Gemmatimonadota bacterium]